MTVLLDVLATTAALATAVIFGTDTLGALVMRAAFIFSRPRLVAGDRG